MYATKYEPSRKQVGAWLKRKTNRNARPLSQAELKAYSRRDPFTAGWELGVEICSKTWILHVLLERTFPHSQPRIALSCPEKFLEFPHVESNRLICLPEIPIDLYRPFEMVRQALEDSCALIEGCVSQNQDDEFRREFVSYWNQSVSSAAKPIRSLLNDFEGTRSVSVWHGQHADIVGEDPDQIVHWLRARGIEEPRAGGYSVDPGIFVRLDTAPVPDDFPKTIDEARSWLSAEGPGVIGILEDLLPTSIITIVAGYTPQDSGAGLVGLRVYGPASFDRPGFRPGHVPPAIGVPTWYGKAGIEGQKVERIDPAWVHGRGVNPDQEKLHMKTVSIFGCGALGSHIAVRLAQSGVGNFLLVDPEELVSANVGRHVLGIGSIGKNKATSLAASISERFPHLEKVQAFPLAWQSLTDEQLQQVADSDLIISAIADWKAEGPLNDWHQMSGVDIPIMYAWLEEFAAAGHALLIRLSPGCLSCVVGPSGASECETNWPDEVIELQEPACGVFFAPFGPTELGFTEALVSDLALDVLTDRVENSCHRVYATTTQRVVELGGEWTQQHMGFRPNGFEGRITYEKEVLPSTDCPICSKHAQAA